MTSKKKQKKRKRNKFQLMINFLIRRPEEVWSDTGRIKNEMNLAKKLFKINNDIFFWLGLDLRFRLNSLAWFFTQRGKNFLRLEKERNKIGKNIIIV